MSVAFSAVSAMAALRAQIEDRLNRSEDFRALKALDKAIADVTAQLQVPGAQVVAALQATPAAMILPTAPVAPPAAPAQMAPAQVVRPQPAPVPGSHSALMQRLTASFPGVSTARAVPAGQNAA